MVLKKNFQGPRGKNGKVRKFRRVILKAMLERVTRRATRSDSSGNDFITKVVGCERFTLFSRHLPECPFEMC